jgi:DNA (cytosine-5)-methyltransferase 1
VDQRRMGRRGDGIPDETYRFKGLGNAVVPQIPELIGRAIMEAEGMK